VVLVILSVNDEIPPMKFRWYQQCKKIVGSTYGVIRSRKLKKTDKTMQNEKRQTYKQDCPGKEYKD
jgi:hypothetical protein